jgi:predicted dehydrogenase
VRALIEPARTIDEVEVAAVAARDPKRAEGFAEEYGIPLVHPSYDVLLADESLDAIYVPLANSLHARWTIAALEAGHHVLCEKPFASNATQAAEMVAAAERTGRILMEAFHWRYHPVASRMMELACAIGPLEALEARFSVSIPSDSVRYELAMAGGSFMDQGCYCVHMVRTIANGNPRIISATAVEGPTGIDLSMEAVLRFDNGIDAVVSSSMIGETSWPESMFVRAHGRGGDMNVLNPMAPQRGHRIQAELSDGSTIDDVIESGTSYEHQLQAFCRVVSGKEKPITGGADAVATMAAIDDVYIASGLGIRT